MVGNPHLSISFDPPHTENSQWLGDGKETPSTTPSQERQRRESRSVIVIIVVDLLAQQTEKLSNNMYTLYQKVP